MVKLLEATLARPLHAPLCTTGQRQRRGCHCVTLRSAGRPPCSARHARRCTPIWAPDRRCAGRDASPRWR
eukprot:364430-Chlamydomonas_euryale.AAC.11